MRLQLFLRGPEYFFEAILPLQAIKKPFEDASAFKGLLM
jgi:hypothetical protein